MLTLAFFNVIGLVAGIGMEDSERNVQLHKEATQRGGRPE